LKEKQALILIDVWKGMNPEWDVYANKVIEKGIKPLLEYARKKRILIVHHYYNSELKYPNALSVLSGELVLMPSANWLHKNGYKTLIYGGFATNECLLYKRQPSGLWDETGHPLYIENGGLVFMAREGFKILVIKEATLGVDNDLSKLEKVTNAALLEIKHNYGKIVSLKDLKNEKYKP